MKASLLIAVVALGVAGCSSSSSTTTESTAPVVAHQAATTPPVTTTPVPIVRAHTVRTAGRPDPFVALFGPPTGGSSNPAPTKVAVSTFPNIPTLPGFENAPGANNPWNSVRLTGVVDHGVRTAIVEAGGKSYFVHPGDRIDDKYTVLSIGPDFITLATEKEERHFSLGG